MAAVELKNTTLFNDANLVSYYQLENANDNKGANNLTNNGSVAFNAAKFNNGADFGNPNTTPTYLSLASNLGIDGGNITLAAWFKLATESQTAYIISQQSATSKVGYFLEYLVNSGGGTQSVVFKRLQNGIVEVVGTFVCGSLGTTTFNHIVGTYDGTNIKLYFNGVLKDTQAASGSGSTALSSDFEIGDRAASNPGFAGIIDDAAVFSRALIAQEVSDLFSGADATTTSTTTSTTTTSTSTTTTSTSSSTTTTSTSTTSSTSSSTTTTSTSSSTTTTSTSTTLTGTTTSTSSSTSTSTSTTTTWPYGVEIPSNATKPSGEIKESTESAELGFTVIRKSEQL